MIFTMTSLELYQTMANLYSRCASLRTPPKDAQMSQRQREDLCTFLIEGYQCQLKWIATQRSVLSNTKSNEARSSCSYLKNLDLYSTRTVLRAWEEAQFNAMSLIKHANCSLYQSWCAFATIQHWKTAKLLLEVLNSKDGGILNDDDKEVQKLQQKVTVLPRLAEMLMQRVCTTTNGEFPPSADDWRLYLECLVTVEKFDDAIEILSSVKCGTEKQSRQINDEKDVKHHLGSLIQLSERERIEMIAELNIKSGRYGEASKLYIDTLLKLLPDQWSYWEAIVQCSFKCHDMNYDNVVKDCNQVLDRVIESQQLLRSEGKASRVPIRGPYLCRVYLIAEGIRQCSTNDAESLCNAIIKYGNMFCSLVSCCFQDLRPYIEILISMSHDGYKSDVVSKIVDSAKRIRKENNLMIESSPEKKESSDEKKERRSELRAYIYSIKVCFEVWYQCLCRCEEHNEKKEVNDFFSTSVPSVDDLVYLWGEVIDLGSKPIDGGQKETLPGDDLILLANQLLIHQNSSQPEEVKSNIYVLATTILDAAIAQSPYNPYFRIAAINIYTKMGAAKRAYELFIDMDISHIQLDSCSYIILSQLVNNILHNEAVNLAGKILNLHTTSARDVSKFMPKAFDNGNLQKGLEMISWQRLEMNHSLQLLRAKSIIMNLAPLFNKETGEEKAESSYFGAIHGLCGNQSSDVLRAEKFVRNSSNNYTAPSLIQYANFTHYDRINKIIPLSDNSDLSINQIEILEKTFHGDSIQSSLSSAQINAILARVVLFVDVCKAPKKGKAAKYAIGDELDIRAQSVLQSLSNAEAFFSIPSEKFNVHAGLWKVILCLCQTICTLGAGRGSTEERTIPSDDSLAQRESRCTKLLNSASKNVEEVMSVWESLINEIGNEVEKSELCCNLFTELVLPIYSIIRITANLFGLYTWSKRKRHTKEAVGALANLALMFKKLLNLIHPQIDSNQGSDLDEIKDLLSYMVPKSSVSINLNENGRIEKIIEKCQAQKSEKEQMIERLFSELIQELDTFNEQD